MKRLSGICPVVAMPFTPGGRVDYDSFERLVDYLLGTGVSALTLFGLASEFYKLDDVERARCMSLMLGRTSQHPDVAGVISITDHSWEVATQRAQQAEEAGADAINILPPFFLGPSETAITEHLSRVLSAVSIPAIVQYAPLQTSVRLPAAFFARLSLEHSNLKFVKVETQPPGKYAAEMIARSSGRLGALVGYAGVQMPDVLERGAAGIQPGCSFVEVYLEIYQRFEAGDTIGARTLHSRLLPYISYWMQGVELIIQVEKTILYRRGLVAADYCRAPGYALDSTERAMIDRFLEEFYPGWQAHKGTDTVSSGEGAEHEQQSVRD